jgi:hypothetical protein
MPATPETLSPAEAAIQEAAVARESFFKQADDAFAASSAARAAINPMAAALDKLPNQLSAAVTQAAGLPPAAASAQSNVSSQELTTPTRSPDGRFTKREQTSQPAQSDTPATPPPAALAPATTAIPGPPTAAGASSTPPAAQTPETAGQTSTSGQPTLHPDFTDVPPADALDKPGTRLQAKDWRRVHALKDYHANQAEQLRRELEAARSSKPTTANGQLPPEIQQQLTTLQQERDTILAKLEAVAVEKSPRFEAAFKPRVEAAITTAKGVVGPDRADRVAQLLALPESSYRDEQLEALVQDIGPTTLRAQKLLQAVAEVDRVAQEKQAVLAQGSQFYKQFQAEEQQAIQRQRQERQAQLESTFNTVAKDWQGANLGLTDNDLTLARDVYMGNRTPQELATVAMWVAYGPKAAATAHRLQQQLDAANAELSRLRSATPGNANDAGGMIASDDAPSVGGLEGLIQTIVRNAPGLR